MAWLTNEVLFYGGMIISACSLAVGIAYYAISYINRIRLNIKLDEEYGKSVDS